MAALWRCEADLADPPNGAARTHLQSPALGRYGLAQQDAHGVGSAICREIRNSISPLWPW
jgi:hypothetical protein